MNSRYTIIIQWSAEDQCYIVSLPEWGDYCHTHGDTYEEALHNAREVLELLTESTLDEGKPLPAPQLFGQVLQST
jgi:antitoxin HicB